MLELDLLLNKFLDENYEDLDDNLRYEFSLLLDLSDPELLSILIYEVSDINKKNKYYNIINKILNHKKHNNF